VGMELLGASVTTSAAVAALCARRGRLARRMSVSRPKLSWTEEAETARQWPMPSDDKAAAMSAEAPVSKHRAEPGSVL
jgi:hypothetical protein